jgi:Exostosin family
MSSIYLTEVNTGADRISRYDSFALLRAAARADCFRQHSLCDDPEAADLILCADAGARTFFDVLSHALCTRFLERFFFYSTSDYVFPILPGIYPSLAAADVDLTRTRSGPYLHVVGSDHIRSSPIPENARFLFSFAGNCETAKVRAPLSALKHDRAIVLDTSGDVGRREGQTAEIYARYTSRYLELLADSKFILCPRGAGPSSIRLFETMRAGRVPVIISDEWAEPVGPEWQTFSVRIPERDVVSIPQRLERLEGVAAEMGLRARRAWETHFALDVVFHWLVEQCLAMKSARRWPERVQQWLVRRKLFTVRHFRPAVLARFKRSVRGLIRGGT